MRTIAETSRETKLLVKLFVDMSIDDVISFAQASKAVGFQVKSTLPAYSSARRIATRDHGVVIDGVRGIGFKKIAGDAIVRARGSMHLKSIRKRAGKGALEMEVAISQNLDDKTALEASEKLTRFRLLRDVAVGAKTNRRQPHQPETAEPVDIRSRLATVR